MDCAIDSLSLLHRPTKTGKVGFFTDSRNPDDGFSLQSSSLAQELESELKNGWHPDEVRGWPSVKLCTVNQFWKTGGLRRRGDELDDISRERPYRKQNGISHLCAAFAISQLGQAKKREVKAALYELREFVPPPSVLIFRKQDTTLLWLVRDEKNPEIPPAARGSKDKTRQLYRRVTRHLNELLAQALGARPNQANATSLIPLPSASSVWEPLADPVYHYTLPELAKFLNLPNGPSRNRRRNATASPKDPKKQRAYVEGHQVRLWRLWHLVELRGSLTLEHGKEAITLLAVFSRGSGKSCEETLQESERLNGFIVPQLGDEARVARVLNVFDKTFRITDKQIADQLGITRAESKQVRWPVASVYKTASEIALPPPTLKPKEQRMALLRSLDRVPLMSEWKGILKGHGFSVPARATLARDLAEFRASFLRSSYLS